MGYNYWKMMDRVGVAVCAQKPENWRGKESFDGYIFEPSEKASREKAEEWARRYENRWDKDKETIVIDPNVYEFDNEGFTVTILDSAGGSSQGGRLSFWKCRVEKDGVSFIVGVNDAILADLIRNSDIEQGRVKQKLMFARRGGQPGFIHENMEAYQEAVADMKKKADLKSAKKTSKWEIGGVYSTLTQTDICIGELWDHYEVVEKKDDYWYSRTKEVLQKRDKPVKVTGWVHVYTQYGDEINLTKILEEKSEKSYAWFDTGKPPARAKAEQLEVTDRDLELIDKLLSVREDSISYGDPKINNRFTRVK